MDLSIITNPLVLGIIATIIIYIYFYWEEKKKGNEKKYLNNYTNFIMPSIIGIFIWFFISSIYTPINEPEKLNNVQPTPFSIEKTIEPNSINNVKKPNLLNTKFLDKTKLLNNTSDSLNNDTYHLIGKGIGKLPNTDVFIDIAKF